MKSYQKNLVAIPYLLILLACVLSVLPFFIWGNLYAHDAEFHLRWSKSFWEVFRKGILYPRWLPKLNAGLGSPAFFFYPPIPYYFSSFFYWIFESWSKNPMHPLFLSSWLARFLSGVFMYIWLRTFTEKHASLISAIIYIIMPYHLAIDCGYRFAYGELWAFCWLPLILFFVKKICEKKIIYLPSLALSYAALIMSHMPSVVIFSIIPILYAVLESKDENRIKNSVSAATGMLIGVMLSSIYLFPALLTQENISMGKMVTGSYFYMNNFLGTKPVIGWPESVWSYIFEISGFCCILGCIFWLLFWRKLSSINQNRSIFWMIILLFSFYMCIPLSKPVWALFPVLKYISFPWRFNLLVSLALSVVLALCACPKNNTKAISLFSCSHNRLLLLVILGVVLSLNIPAYRVAFANVNINKYLLKNYDFSGMDPLEYKPREVNDIQRLQEKYSAAPRAMILEGKGDIIIETWESRKIRILTNGITPLTLWIKQYYYDGWVAKIYGENELFEKKEKNDLLSPEGLIQIEVPSGKQQITFQLVRSSVEKAGQTISSLTFIFLFISLIYLNIKSITIGELY